MNKRIIITGATGLIGKHLSKALIDKGYDVYAFTRSVESSRKELPHVRHFIKWDYHKPDTWKKEVDGAYAIIHLAGANLFGKRWNDAYKKEIIESREISTRSLVNAIAEAKHKPEVFISSSAVGIYGNRGDESLDENSSLGNDFLAQVCKVWENEASKVEQYGVRRVSIRTGIVLDKEEGALPKMITPYNFYIGGPLGNGKQWYPWIHIRDIVKIYIYALESDLSGAVNAVSPTQVTMNQFSKSLADVISKPDKFKVPAFALRIAVGEGAAAILSSQKVVPKVLLEKGFEFRYPMLRPALLQMLQDHPF